VIPGKFPEGPAAGGGVAVGALLLGVLDPMEESLGVLPGDKVTLRCPPSGVRGWTRYRFGRLARAGITLITATSGH
jgi:hypothetical protein